MSKRKRETQREGVSERVYRHTEGIAEMTAPSYISTKEQRTLCDSVDRKIDGRTWEDGTPHDLLFDVSLGALHE